MRVVCWMLHLLARRTRAVIAETMNPAHGREVGAFRNGELGEDRGSAGPGEVRRPRAQGREGREGPRTMYTVDPSHIVR